MHWSNYILLAKFVQFCHKTEVYSKKKEQKKSLKFSHRLEKSAVSIHLLIPIFAFCLISKKKKKKIELYNAKLTENIGKPK